MTPEPTPDIAAPVGGSALAAGDARSDPAMRALYRMSRTAGVGLQDYAAINVRAVIGLLLGCASVLAYIFADSLLPLIIPLAGIVVSIIGFVQIQRSSGTQTGRLLALGGLALSLGFAGLTFGKQWRVHATQSDAQAQMRSMIATFAAASASGDGSQAYGLFDNAFRKTVSLDTFNRTLASRKNALFAGDAASTFVLGPTVLFESQPDGSLTAASALMVVEGGKVVDGRRQRIEVPAVFIRENGEWRFRDIQNWFPSTAPKPPQ